VGRTVESYAVAISFALFLNSLRGKRIFAFEKTMKLNKFLASFSYSLYLVHFPVMLFTLACLSQFGRFQQIRVGYLPSDRDGVFAYLVTIFIVLLFSWLFSLATESQTATLRKMLKRKFGIDKA
jgi:peptidoglycan/LPS O-acetylase OafA/YrhL